MTLEQATAIQAAAASEGIELEVRENYSGRGMYGKTTACVVGHESDIVHFAETAGIDSRELEWDNMGRQHVAY